MSGGADAAGHPPAFAGVIMDLGGVVLNSPFEAIIEYERELGIPRDTINSVIARAGEGGAFVALEKGEMTIEEFAAPFARDCELVDGAAAVDGRELMVRICNACTPRPLVFDALRLLKEEPGVRTAALTNNFLVGERPGEQQRLAFIDVMEQVHDVFDVVVESAVERLRKPDPAIYTLACARLGVAPAQAVFVDDIGRNLKPAKALGMQTVKCALDDRSGARALGSLATLLGGDVGRRLQALLRRARL